MAVWRCAIFDMQALKHSNKSMTDWAQILGINRGHVEKDFPHIWDQSHTFTTFKVNPTVLQKYISRWS